MKAALVDGDVVVYIAGFAAEEAWYECVDGTIHPTKGKAKEHCIKLGEDTETIVERVEAEPKSHALRLVKNILVKVKDRTGAKELRIFLSGKNNFREEVATIKPYKGNRIARKPFHYQNIRDYLKEVYNAEVVDGMEADDALGINQKPDTCICTIDKDLDMVEGYHYNFQKDKLYEVRSEKAVHFFYTQLLTGDSVDNIQGVPGIGKKKAEKILLGLTEEEDLFWKVLCEYEKKYDKPMEALVENANLLWILRQETIGWTNPA